MFQHARRDGDSNDAAGSGMNDVPLDVAAHCFATLECLAHRVDQTKAYLKAEAYAASTLALAAIDVSRVNLHENARFMCSDDPDHAYRRSEQIHERAVRMHKQITFALRTTDAMSHRREYQPDEQAHAIRTMHDNVEVWDDVCCCEPEPRWQAIADDIGAN